MRRSTTTALSLSAVIAALALTGCADHADSAGSTASAQQGGGTPTASAPLSSAQLNKRLLNESDLGEGYTRKPETARRNDDVSVIGCPALEKLGGDSATGAGLDFAHKTKASFTYTGSSSSEVSEELYSDGPAKLSTGISKVFDAMLSCPSYQVASGSTVIDMGTAKSAAPDLGDEQWSQLLTFTAGGQRSVVKQTAIRTGNILVLVSGSPGLVDSHLSKALTKARTTR
ncbi:putative secreted protein [Streptomyces albus]|uniref:Putative secreted protein n=1 Tax=Streptomyces albus (strain ATCC 21838 / DSM 41398 / FERM P-419 / JCM 4703 / NBRC 107858) TaxID=1081613 RepID=A0A0B5EQM7_STRA4|nr:putative secreted protein [Streptomyces albus]AOU75905.1 putative secreted protein [Streptomyces albus]AYN31711.1 hypothetical protein DUI70_1208 [Streptomyces albus]